MLFINFATRLRFNFPTKDVWSFSLKPFRLSLEFLCTLFISKSPSQVEAACIWCQLSKCWTGSREVNFSFKIVFKLINPCETKFWLLNYFCLKAWMNSCNLEIKKPLKMLFTTPCLQYSTKLSLNTGKAVLTLSYVHFRGHNNFVKRPTVKWRYSEPTMNIK